MKSCHCWRDRGSLTLMSEKAIPECSVLFSEVWCDDVCWCDGGDVLLRFALLRWCSVFINTCSLHVWRETQGFQLRLVMFGDEDVCDVHIFWNLMVTVKHPTECSLHSVLYSWTCTVTIQTHEGKYKRSVCLITETTVVCVAPLYFMNPLSLSQLVWCYTWQWHAGERCIVGKTVCEFEWSHSHWFSEWRRRALFLCLWCDVRLKDSSK